MESSEAAGYGYKYSKGIELSSNGKHLTIYHALTNTGSKPINTDFYNHNFFNVDADPIGPNYRIIFPSEVKAKDLRGRFGELVTIDGLQLRFKDKLTDGFVMAGLTGFEPPEGKPLEFEMFHGPSSVRVTVTNRGPFAKFNVWGVKTTICPEPFSRVDDLAPGFSRAWTTVYRFDHHPPRK
jgi:hypothetical protein